MGTHRSDLRAPRARELARPADRAAPPVHLLPGAPARVRVEPRERRGAGPTSVQRGLRRAVLARDRSGRGRSHALPRPSRGAGPLARGGRGHRLSRSRARGAARIRGCSGRAGGHAPDGPGRPRIQHGDRARAHASGDSAVHAAAPAARAQGATGLAAALRPRPRPPRGPGRDPGGPGDARRPLRGAALRLGQRILRPRGPRARLFRGRHRGYQRADLWTDEDWVWRGHEAIEYPAVWELVDGAWVYRTLFDRLPLDRVA